MMVSRHAAFSILPSAAVYYFTGSLLKTALFISGAVFIDVDHYIDYVFRKKSLSLLAAYRYNIALSKLCIKRLNDKPIIHCFHTVEFFLVMALVSFFLPSVWWLLAGMAFHIALDLVEIIRSYDRGVRSFSFIWNRYRNKQGRRRFLSGR